MKTKASKGESCSTGGKKNRSRCSKTIPAGDLPGSRGTLREKTPRSVRCQDRIPVRPRPGLTRQSLREAEKKERNGGETRESVGEKQVPGKGFLAVPEERTRLPLEPSVLILGESKRRPELSRWGGDRHCRSGGSAGPEDNSRCWVVRTNEKERLRCSNVLKKFPAERDKRHHARKARGLIGGRVGGSPRKDCTALKRNTATRGTQIPREKPLLSVAHYDPA